MTIELTKEQIEQYEKDGELTIKAPKEKKEFPQYGDEFWWTGNGGGIFSDKWTTHLVDKRRFDYGNIYQTKEEAIKARDIQLAKTRVKRAIAKANDGWEPDWSNREKLKYVVEYDYDFDKVSITNYSFIKSQPNWMYMKSEKIAEQILEKYKEDLELIFAE